MTFEFRDYPRTLGELPAEKIVHLLRPAYASMRTLCGLGLRHNVWRITIEGAKHNVAGDGWAVCVRCCQRLAETRQSCVRP